MIELVDFIKLHNRQITDFSISYDSKKIAYVYGNLDLPHSLYAYDIKQRQIRLFDVENSRDYMTFKGLDQHSPSWSHDGSKLAYLSLYNNKAQINIYDFKRNETTYSSQLEYQTMNAFDGVLSKDIFWSSDDRFIVAPYYEFGRKNIYNNSVDFIQSLFILDTHSYSFKICLQLDSEYKIYDITDSKIFYGINNKLFLYDINSSKSEDIKRKEHLINKIHGENFLFADVSENTILFGINDKVISEVEIEGDLINPVDVSNDGSFALFTVNRRMSVYLIKLMDNGQVVYLSDENEVTYIKNHHTEPKHINNLVFFLKSSIKLHNEFFISNGAKTKQITDFNSSIIDKLDIKVIVDQYKSKDCYIETTILLPSNFDLNKKYPALIFIHGGPNIYETMSVQSLISSRAESIAIQLCQEGFIIAIPNYRGTKGYGSKHMEKVPYFSMKFADHTFEDIINCKSMLIQKYSANDKKIGLYGTSYGAQITGWTVSKVNDFYAAAGVVAVSYDESDYSIISKVNNIQCPFLIVETGMAEGRYQVGKALYNKLIEHDKQTEYYIYPNAFHNGGWNDKYKIDYIHKLVSFFKKYI